MGKTSELKGLYKLPPSERLSLVAKFADLTYEETEILRKSGALSLEQADKMIENVIGTFQLPLGVATNFLINNKDYLIPMVIEEPSVVAAASNAAKIARVRGGFFTESTKPVMIGQIQVTNVKNPSEAYKAILAEKDQILKIANAQDPLLIKLGGGVIDVEARPIDTRAGPMVIVHLLIDVRDAMGANVVNTMSEAVSPLIEQLTGGKVLLRIVSNLAVYRVARARAVFEKEALGGEEVVDAIIKAYAFAATDPYRCTTHNKGIMNGVIAVAMSTANDTRALESGAHAYASMGGVYKPLSEWSKTSDGDLRGEIEMPVAIGLIGGATAVHPIAKITRKILGVKTARDLGEVMAAVGLANNLAAMRALATEGIQKGHLRLHARNIAASVGAQGDMIDAVAERIIAEKKIRMDRAKEILEELRKSSKK